jgi:APA family basic amino acid/polyamine antiporter
MPLKRELGLGAAIAAVCGEAIALGIFLTPAAMAKSLGSPLLLLGVWLAMALMACAGAVCYAELAITLPEAGGAYVYLREFYGERTAFLYGWMSIVVMDSGLAAALAVGATAYIATLVPAAARFPIVTAAVLLLGMAAINYSGTRISGRFMATVNWLKLIVVGLLIVWAFASHGFSHTNLLPLATRRPGSDLLAMGIAGAFINAFFSYGGWWDVTKLAGEIREPRKNLPRALIIGVLAVTLIYVGLSAAFLHVVPLQQVTSNQAFVAQFGQALFGHTGAVVLSICVLISVLGGLAALTLAAPRVYFAMAQNGQFFRAFGRLHPRFNSPANAILLQLLCSLAVLGLGAFDKIISYIIFTAVIFLALTGAAVFRLAEARQQWWYPFAPVLYILCCGAVALMIVMRNPLEAVLGVGVVLLGYPLYRKLSKSQHRSELPLQAVVNE